MNLHDAICHSAEPVFSILESERTAAKIIIICYVHYRKNQLSYMIQASPAIADQILPPSIPYLAQNMTVCCVSRDKREGPHFNSQISSL